MDGLRSQQSSFGPTKTLISGEFLLVSCGGGCGWSLNLDCAVQYTGNDWFSGHRFSENDRFSRHFVQKNILEKN